jgi:hypothetical protein
MALTSTFLKSRYRIMPRQETVTYKPANVGVPSSVPGARQRPLSLDEQEAAGIDIEIVTCLWILPAATLVGANGAPIVPKLGDSITQADGTLWFVEKADSALLKAEYKCASTRGR